jgi:hypothetical protein
LITVSRVLMECPSSISTSLSFIMIISFICASCFLSRPTTTNTVPGITSRLPRSSTRDSLLSRMRSKDFTFNKTQRLSENDNRDD